MYTKFQAFLQEELGQIKEAGLFKNERIITSPQGAAISVSTGQEVLNFCANNYLGLSNNPKLVEAAKVALDERGYGMSSVRFICGTQDIHKTLEKKLRTFLVRKIPFFMLPLSMPMEAFSNLFWVLKMQ